MKIHMHQSIEQSSNVMEKIVDIGYYIVTDHPVQLLQYDFWLGSSKDLQTWALFKTKRADADADDEFTPEHLVIWLAAPPKGYSETIGAILFEVYIETLKGTSLDDVLIKSVISKNPFPVYQTVANYLPIAPKEWLTLPAEIVLSIKPSMGTGLSDATFEEFKMESIEDVISTLFATQDSSIRLYYTLAIVGIVPLAAYEVDWPLSRRGKNSPFKRSAKIQGDVPWEDESNTAIVTMYQGDSDRRSMYYFGKPVTRISVAGITPEKAIDNWHQISRFLRRLK